MRSLSVLLILGLLLSAVVPALAGDKQPVSDDRIHDEVRLKLAGSPDVGGGGIDVDVQQGVVTLSGKVRRERQKVKAEKITKKVKGVKKVVNNIQAEMQ